MAVVGTVAVVAAAEVVPVNFQTDSSYPGSAAVVLRIDLLCLDLVVAVVVVRQTDCPSRQASADYRINSMFLGFVESVDCQTIRPTLTVAAGAAAAATARTSCRQRGCRHRFVWPAFQISSSSQLGLKVPIHKDKLQQEHRAIVALKETGCVKLFSSGFYLLFFFLLFFSA